MAYLIKLTKRKHIFLFFLFCYLFCFYFNNSNDCRASQLKILEEGQKSITIEFTSTLPQIREKEINGTVYHIITVPGAGITQQPGKPQLPVQGTLIALPPTATANIEILEKEIKFFENILICPSPQKISVTENDVYHIKEEFIIDQASYAQDCWIPEQPFIIHENG